MKKICIIAIVVLISVVTSIQFKSIDSNADHTNKSDKCFTWNNATIYFAMIDRFYDGNENNNENYSRYENVNVDYKKVYSFKHWLYGYIQRYPVV